MKEGGASYTPLPVRFFQLFNKFSPDISIVLLTFEISIFYLWGNAIGGWGYSEVKDDHLVILCKL